SDAGQPIGVTARVEAGSLSIGVSDRGAGIPAREQSRIFQKFVRGADAKLNGVRGVGIGLALVRRIAEAHRGSVHLVSEADRGSTFTLVIPAADPGDRLPASAPKRHAEPSTRATRSPRFRQRPGSEA